MHERNTKTGVKNNFKVLTEQYEGMSWDFSGNPVVKTAYFHCREHRFSPWLGPHAAWYGKKKKKKKKGNKVSLSEMGYTDTH